MKTPTICWRALGSRVTSLALALALLLSLMPALTPQAKAASWMDPYLEKVQEWGVMRGDIQGNLNANNYITRAEFVTMTNRAYGYTATGRNPYKDATVDDWFYEDLGIAYNTGYFAGTSTNTAAPLANLTREQAATLLGRNMMLLEGTGETLAFSDSRELSSWSRQMVESAAKEGFVSGYPDGTFKPQGYVTRGEVASMLVRAVGQPIQDSGVHSLGTVNSNLTITAPGVTLRDTTINGNLYISAGVGLSNAVLENVDVRGKIVVAGAGESEEGEHSVVLRNVEADELVMDSLSDQFVTLRAEGDTDIKNVYARTQVYLEDMTDDGKGLQNILLKAEDNTPFQLAGNIKNVRLETSGSTLTIAQGVTKTLTVDEAALKTTVDIQNKAIVTTVNLDAGTNIIGGGDISHLNVNVPGSTVAMLPDTITIRPGVTADIAEVNMDSVAAVESSENPRLLAGYPKEQNVAPTSAEVVFKTNKTGTLYWGLTALADGSLDEDELIKPPAYSGKILKSGSIAMETSNTEMLTKLSGLVSDGSYYVSAVLVDSRGMRSPVKVVAFTTPDNTVPKFMQSEMTLVTNEDAQVTVMSNKTCQLYWAVLPKGSTAPKAADFKAGAIEGNLGSGNMQVTKNSTHPFYVNSPSGNLVEEQTYDLYLWLTDFDGAKSSSVKKLTFSTVDKTPPVVTAIYQSNQTAKAITISFDINEAATLYWGVVLAGDSLIRPVGNETKPPELNELAAKLQVEAGTYAIKKGNKSLSKSGNTVTFTISGLTEQTAYDLYYVAKDKAGNYSERVQVLQGIKTEDKNAPTVEQEFTEFTSNGNPLPETDVELHFSEEVWGYYTENSSKKYHDFLSLYNDVVNASILEQPGEKRELAKAIRQYITLYTVDATTGKAVKAVDLADVETDATKKDTWVIDYREAIVTREEGKTTITFPTDRQNPENGALNLASGGTYYFVLNSISDTSGNAMPKTELPRFTTVFAKVTLGVGLTSRISAEEAKSLLDTYKDKDDSIRIDTSFFMTPESTTRVEKSIKWDMLLWTDTTMKYVVYTREMGPNGTWGAWEELNAVDANVASASHEDGRLSASYFQALRGYDTSRFPDLNQLTQQREVAVHVISVDGDTDYESWNANITMNVDVIAGTAYQVGLAGDTSLLYKSNYDNAINAGAVPIGEGKPSPFTILIPFSDKVAPEFSEGHPTFQVGDISATLNFSLDGPGTVYYMLVPLSKKDGKTGPVTGTDYTAPVQPLTKADNMAPAIENVPKSYEDIQKNPDGSRAEMYLSTPYNTQVTKGNSNTNTGVISGNTKSQGSNLDANYTYSFKVDGLKPNTTYLVYLVNQGVSAVYSDTMCYTFTTLEAERPVIEINRTTSNLATISVDKSSNLHYALFPSSSLEGNSQFAAKFSEVAGTAESGWSNVSGYSNVKTVLDAMLTPYQNQGSVFDHFATEKTKSDCADLIRQGSTEYVTGPVMSKDLYIGVTGSASKGSEIVGPMTGMIGKNYYTLLVVGRTVNSSGDAFSASRSYYNEDNTPLTITTNLVTAQVVGGATCRGQLEVTFSDSLYYRVQTTGAGGAENTYPVYYCTSSDVHADTVGDHVNINNLLDITCLTGQVDLQNSAPTTCKSVGDTLKFDLKYVGDGTTIKIKKNICGTNKVVRDNLDLTIKIVKHTDENGTVTWEAQVLNEAWLTADTTTKK